MAPLPRRFIGQQLIYPLYTFQIIGLSQRDGGNRFGEGERECNRKSKDTLSVFCAAASPPGSKGFTSLHSASGLVFRGSSGRGAW